jgi:SAM-dependent methyltransferase
MDLAGVRTGQRVLDVGSGPGALTAELVARVGASKVVAVDPSASFVEAVGARYPGIEALLASADRLPFADDSFDATLAQLVVHFMPDPVAGLIEMARVTCRDGVVAASVWDHAGRHGPLATFWAAAREMVPDVNDESHLPGVREGHLIELFTAAGLRKIQDATLTVTLEHPTFDAGWGPYTGGVGPAGSFVAGLDPERQAELRESCRSRLGDGPVKITALAWAARGLA